MSINTKTRIETKIRDELNPSTLIVVNESHMHNVPPDAETHFKVTIVSESFASKRLVQRHQLIYRILADELASGVHALALHTYTTEEWQEKKESSPESPPCLG